HGLFSVARAAGRAQGSLAQRRRWRLPSGDCISTPSRLSTRPHPPGYDARRFDGWSVLQPPAGGIASSIPDGVRGGGALPMAPRSGPPEAGSRPGGRAGAAAALVGRRDELRVLEEL